MSMLVAQKAKPWSPRRITSLASISDSLRLIVLSLKCNLDVSVRALGQAADPSGWARSAKATRISLAVVSSPNGAWRSAQFVAC